MTILQNATFEGTPHHEVRPGSGVRGSTVRRWLRDQAAVYEGITGVKAPNAASIAATPHVHDGTDGALIRLPLFASAHRMSLPPRSTALFDGGISYEGFYPVDWRPFFTPKGVSQIAVLVQSSPGTVKSLRVTTQDASFAVVGRMDGSEALSEPWFQSGDDPVHAFIVDVDPGAVNLFKLEAWDGKYDVGEAVGYAFDETEETRRALPTGRRITSIVAVPIARAPHIVPAATRPSLADDARVKTPAAFTSFDDHLVQDDRGLASYVLVNAQKNDALLYERLVGRPAGARSSLTHAGHNHKGGGDELGVDIDHALGSWGYGVLRPPSSGIANEFNDVMYEDAPAGNASFRPSDAWSGHPSAPWLHMGAASTNTDYELFRHRVRIPDLAAANLASGTGKLKLAALVWDAGVGLSVKASLGDTAAANWDTESTVTASGTGRELITISALECSRPEFINALRIRIRFTTTKQAALGVYGTCLYYEA